MQFFINKLLEINEVIIIKYQINETGINTEKNT